MNTEKVFDTRTELNEIADIIAYVDQTTLNDRSTQFENNNKFASLIDGAFAAQDDWEFKRICGKTGCEIGKITNEEYFELERIHGTEKAMRLIRFMQRQYISPLWLVTDSDALDNLSIYDPIGYFVYASSKILPVNQGLVKVSPTQDIEAAQLAVLREKHALWSNLQTIPKVQIFHANEIMRRFLAVFLPAKANHLTREIFGQFELTNLPSVIDVWIKSVSEAIATILKYEMKRGRIARKLHYDDIIKLKNIYVGNSNFRAQNKLRKRTEMETILDQLQDFIPRKVGQPQHTLQPSMLKSEIEKATKKKQPTGRIQEHEGAFTLKFGSSE